MSKLPQYFSLVRAKILEGPICGIGLGGELLQPVRQAEQFFNGQPAENWVSAHRERWITARMTAPLGVILQTIPQRRRDLRAVGESDSA